ncbi:MAG TPA: MAPEG family protein [Caulobacteraceae bacterium]|nr:MAPEG family protein [Caulobacteraceae bacterium]
MTRDAELNLLTQNHALVAIVTLCALILYFVMGLRVGRARSKYGVVAPAVTGNADFERVFRVQANTLEWLPLFLVSLWLFAIYWNDLVAAGIGVVWILGRLLYMTSYSRDASTRGAGFAVQALATGILLFGALGRIIYVVLDTGGV